MKKMASSDEMDGRNLRKVDEILPKVERKASIHQSAEENLHKQGE